MSTQLSTLCYSGAKVLTRFSSVSARRRWCDRAHLILVGERAQEADEIVDLLLGHRRRGARGAAIERQLRIDVLAMRLRYVIEFLHDAADVLGRDQAVARKVRIRFRP